MRLKISELENIAKAGVKVPTYDVNKVVKDTKEAPIWIHFGAGNIFRGYIARLQDDLLNQGLAFKGIVAADTFDDEIIKKVYIPNDNLTLSATLSAKEPTSYRVIGSVVQGLACHQDFPDYEVMKAYFKAPSLQMVSFTITEKGYALADINGNYSKVAEEDFANGPTHCHHAMSMVTALLYHRYQNGGHPIAVVSMDNCSHNGEKLKAAILTVANEWLKRDYVTKGFIDYISDESRVSFPWSMIDKITPRPAKEVQDEIEKLGFENMSPITTSRHTYIAPFVNSEVSEYLVIEDNFPNGRPCLDKAGVYFTSRETVNKVETMKVTTCLNPLHTALAVYGCLLGYTSIAQEMENVNLIKLIKGIGQEGMKVVVNPGIISPQAFLDEVLYVRLPNKAIPDTPQRIACDTSQKVPVRYGETIKSYLKSETLNEKDLNYIPLAIAGWCRYLLALDDNLNPFELSPDPLVPVLTKVVEPIKQSLKYNGELKEILSNTTIFGTDLSKLEIGKKVEEFFTKMLKKNGVSSTLKENV